jgi:hypothetical protein
MGTGSRLPRSAVVEVGLRGVHEHIQNRGSGATWYRRDDHIQAGKQFITKELPARDAPTSLKIEGPQRFSTDAPRHAGPVDTEDRGGFFDADRSRDRAGELAQRNAGAGLTFIVRRPCNPATNAGSPPAARCSIGPGDRRKRGVQLVEDLLDAQVNLVLSGLDRKFVGVMLLVVVRAGGRAWRGGRRGRWW